jgi:deoxycytidylate deaminase
LEGSNGYIYAEAIRKNGCLHFFSFHYLHNGHVFIVWSLAMDDPHLRWFKLARNVSKLSEYRIKVGCVLIKGNRPISVGFNKIKYNKQFCNPWKKTLHAESVAIKNSDKEYVKNSTAFIYREKHDGSVGLARPCEDCMARLISYGVRTIYYSVEEFPFYKMEKI